MADYIPITETDFLNTRVVGHANGNKPSEITSEMRKLSVGEGFKTECVYTHRTDSKGKNNWCNGAERVRCAARRDGIKIRTSCRDSVLMVFRYE